MAETIEPEEFNYEATAQHLQKGPFAPIFDQSNEKGDHVALKLMCIIDYNAQRLDLYSRMQSAHPKLLAHLMQFHSFGTFKYYDYQTGNELGIRVLKCKFCDLTGPYGRILTHMAINHNEHVRLKTCAYCNRTDLKKHFADDSLHQCFASYLRNNCCEWDEKICKIVTDFYDMLKELADKFKIKAVRSFAGRESVGKNISGCLVQLDEEFNRVISYLYGGNDASRLLKQPMNSSCNEQNSVIISDDEEEDAKEAKGANGTNEVANPNRSSYANAADNATASFSIRAQRASVSLEFNSDLKLQFQFQIKDLEADLSQIFVFYFV